MGARRAGAGPTGSRLTPAAGDLLARFDRLRAALAGTAGAAESVFAGELAAHDGELAVVETAAGPVRALVVCDLSVGDAAEVSDRADAVTLTRPGGRRRRTSRAHATGSRGPSVRSTAGRPWSRRNSTWAPRRRSRRS